jgi:hypothetical protein
VRLLGATVLSAFGLAAFSPLSNVVAGWVSTPADLGKADAIVVLGGGSEWPRGELNSTMLHRTIHGIRLYREGLAPLLVLSGGQRRAPPSEGTGRAGPHDVGRGRAGGASARPSRCSEHPARHRCLSDRGGQVRHGRRIPRAKSRWARPGRGSNVARRLLRRRSVARPLTGRAPRRPGTHAGASGRDRGVCRAESPAGRGADPRNSHAHGYFLSRYLLDERIVDINALRRRSPTACPPSPPLPSASSPARRSPAGAP